MAIYERKTTTKIAQQIGSLLAAGKQVKHSATKLQNAVEMLQREDDAVLKAGQDIEVATSNLANLEKGLTTICEEIKKSQEFDFVAIQLIRPQENIIETVAATEGTEWSGLAKHYLDADLQLRDIQADIAKTRKTEIIRGWDHRFDKWIYETFRHDRFTRIFTPIILFKDDSGRIIPDWLQSCQWTKLEDKQPDPKPPNLKSSHTKNTNFKPIHQIIQIENFPENGEPEIIGTVEAGYEHKSPKKGPQAQKINANNQKAVDKSQKIDKSQVIDLAKLVAQKALDIRKLQLNYVLEVITKQAMEIVKADSASLHFLQHNHEENDRNKYVYEVFSGKIGKKFLKDCPPRKNGLGDQAIRDKEPKYIPNFSEGNTKKELKFFNKEAYIEGIRAMAAIPLLREGQKGVLYVHFREEHEFTSDEIRWLQLFAATAVNAIMHATLYKKMRDQNRQLYTLHSVTQSLSQKTQKNDLLNHIAWNTVNILGADVVTIYGLDSHPGKMRQFTVSIIQIRDDGMQEQRAKAGKLKLKDDQNNRKVKSKRDAIINQILEQKKPLYLSKLEGTMFEGADFVKQEEISSCVAFPLEVESEPVGIMFINYRHDHEFSDDEKKFIETLASSAALAIFKLKHTEKLTKAHTQERSPYTKSIKNKIDES